MAQDSIPIPLPNIEAANQIYLEQLRRIRVQEAVIETQAQQNAALMLSVESCRAAYAAEQQINIRLRQQLRNSDAIIRNQRGMIRLLGGMATVAIGYAIYLEVTN